MNRKKSSTKKVWISSSIICGYFYLFLNLHETSGQTIAFNSETPSLNLTGFKTLIHSGTHVLASQAISHYANFFFYLLKMGKIILFIASSWSFASSEWSEVFQGSVYHKHDMLPNMYWWESPVHLHLAASTFILAYILPFLSLKSICPQHALWPLWFWSLLLHNGITASDFKAVSISAFSLYSSWNTTLMDFISLKNLSIQYTFVK